MNKQQIKKHGYKLSADIIELIDEYTIKMRRFDYWTSVLIGTQALLEACSRISADALEDLPYVEAIPKLKEFIAKFGEDIESQTKTILSQKNGARVLDFTYYYDRLKGEEEE